MNDKETGRVLMVGLGLALSGGSYGISNLKFTRT